MPEWIYLRLNWCEDGGYDVNNEYDITYWLTDTYAQAVTKCRKAEDTSSLSTAESENEREQRRARCKIQYSDDEEQSVAANRHFGKSLENTVVKSVMVTPKAPAALCGSLYKRTAPGCLLFPIFRGNFISFSDSPFNEYRICKI
jgi:hypothetical protein